MSTSETVTRTDLANILNDVLPNNLITASTNYITIGNIGICWGTKTPSSINSQNAVSFPISFSSAPVGFATFNGDAKGSTYNQITVKSATTTGMTVYYYEASGSVKQFNWLAIGQV